MHLGLGVRESREYVYVGPTCFMAVTVITKKRGRPLVTGLVGVSMMSCKRAEDAVRECNAGLSKEAQQVKALVTGNQTPVWPT